MLKKCSKCKKEKPFSEFSKQKRSKDGLRSECKSCEKQYREANKERKAEWGKQYYEANKEKIKQYREENKEKRKQYLKENKERVAEREKQYYEANKERISEYKKQYQKQRKSTDPVFKFSRNVRSLIIGSFKRGTNQFRKDAKTEQILCCTIEEFRSYIESKFTDGMTFDNHGEWHLDHIVPLAKAKTEEGIIRLNHYTNFQPLWADDNLKKGSKL